MVDSHLVMNVLNLMAARDFKERGEENPLLFALSDYLQEALQRSAAATVSLRSELRLLNKHLQLLAELREKPAMADISSSPNAQDVLLPSGALTRVAAAFFSAAASRQSDLLQMQCDISAPDEHGLLQISFTVRKPDAGSALDMVACQKRIKELWASSQWPMRLESDVAWRQDRPEHLQLSYTLASLPAAA